MAFAIGDTVQPINGGPVMKVVKVTKDAVYCALKDNALESAKPFKPQELSLYKEDGDFGVC